MKYDVIIIGGGQAGSMLAITLRQKKFLGSILLISDEPHLPYQRPPLSKDFLTGTIPEKSLYFKSSAYYGKNQVDILLNIHVTSINRTDKCIGLTDGSNFYYEKLVIAAGSELNKLDLHCQEEEIYYLRTINDSMKIRSLLGREQKIVIIGAGYIGLEIAAAASEKNHQVTVLELDNRVMRRSVCTETSRFFEIIHQKKGVKFFFNASIKNIEQQNSQKMIVLNNNEQINADAIIVGVGVKPKIDLAVSAGLDCQNGITVNKFCQTSDDSIFAIGDCANYPNSIYDQRLRLESVQNAMEQAKIAAAKINGLDLPYDQVPWFWSDQYGINLKIAGVFTGYENYVIRGNMDEEKFSVFYINNGRLIAVEAINDNKSFVIGKKLIKNQIIVPITALKDKESNLRSWLI